MAESSIGHQRSTDCFALLVLGMHRSGTSAVTRVVSLLGADLPKKLMEPSPGENEFGFWESAELYNLHEQLLASGGSSWDDWRPFNPNWLDSPAAGPSINRIVEYLQTDFAESSLFVVKDPRICRLMPIWQQILDNLGVAARVLLPVRNPLEVAESLRKRNGISLVRGYIIWLRHVLDAELNSRDIPRLVFDYDYLLQDWRAFASKSSETLGITWPAYSSQTAAKIDAFLSPGQRHHIFDETQLLSHPSVSEWVKQTYSALKMLMADPQSKKAFRLLDKIRAEFDQAVNTFGEIIASEEIISQQLESRLVTSEKSCERQQTQINDVESRAVQLQEEKGSLESRSTVLQSELESSQAALSDKSAESDYLQSELQSSQAALSDKSAESDYLQSELASSQAALSDKSAESDYLQSELESSQAVVKEKSAEFVSLQSELEASQAALSDKSAESDYLQSELESSQAVVKEKSAEFVSLQSELESSQAVLKEKSAEFVGLQSELETSQSALSGLMQSQRNNAAEFVSLQSELESSQAALSDKSAEFVSLQSELATSQATVRDKSAEFVSLQSELESSQATVREKSAEFVSLQSELESSQAALSDKSAEFVSLQSELESSQATVRDKSAEFVSLQSELESSQAALSDKSAEFVSLQSELESSQAALSDKSAESNYLQSELASSQSALSEKSDESIYLQFELETSQAALSDKSAESNYLQSELASSQSALSDKSAESDYLQSELASSQAALSDKSAESDYLQSELASSQAALSDKSAESDYLQSELASSQAALRDKSAESDYLQSELASSQSALSEKSAESDYLQSELASSQSALSEKSAEAVSLQSELAGSQAALSGKSAEAVRLESELASSQAALSQKSAEANDLQSELADAKDRQEKDRSLLLSQIDNEKLLRELYADSRTDLLYRLNDIQTSNTWRLAESVYNIEERRPWVLRGVAALSVVLRGFTVLHPIKYWRLQRDARVIHNSGLFDWVWYLERNADVVESGAHPLKHWLSTGWKEGRKPNRYFDTSWYVQQYLSNSSDAPNPLLHYIRECENIDLEPNAEFNTKKYLLQYPEIEKDGINPLVHFLSNQAEADRDEAQFDVADSEPFLEEANDLSLHVEADQDEAQFDVADSEPFLEEANDLSLHAEADRDEAQFDVADSEPVLEEANDLSLHAEADRDEAQFDVADSEPFLEEANDLSLHVEADQDEAQFDVADSEPFLEEANDLSLHAEADRDEAQFDVADSEPVLEEANDLSLHAEADRDEAQFDVADSEPVLEEANDLSLHAEADRDEAQFDVADSEPVLEEANDLSLHVEADRDEAQFDVADSEPFLEEANDLSLHVEADQDEAQFDVADSEPFLEEANDLSLHAEADRDEDQFDVADSEPFLEQENDLSLDAEADQDEYRFDIDDSEQVVEEESRVDEQADNKTGYFHQKFEQAIRFGQQPGPFYEEEKPHPNPDPLVRAIAFYLPQFHPIAENDENWGKGFTEWSNTSRALPRFSGHYQPRMPGELGYYDLRNPEIHRRQIELAKANGLAGFCYHHYWFNGKKVLRMPLERHFSDPTFDLGFCINWANEPWTAAWDGHNESGVLVDQSHSPEDDLAFIQDIEPYLRDPRYIRVDGKPLLSIYRPTLFPDMRETIQRWQDYCIGQGIGELFIVMVQSFEYNDPKPYGFDGAIEFPPHNAARQSFEPIEFFPDAIQPGVWDYKVMAEYSRNRPSEEFPWFRGVTLGWDNSARKLEGWVFQGCDPQTYGDWLEGQCNNAMEELPPGQRLVFINAWNEWAEGTYLEPDAYFGYAFLNRTGEVLQKYRKIEAPNEALLQYIKARHGDKSEQWLAQHMARFDEFLNRTGEVIQKTSEAEIPAEAETPNEVETPNEALLHYIKARHDDKAAQWLTQHIARFGLPVTSEEVDLAEPSDSEVDAWFDVFVEIAGRNAERLSESEPDVSIVIPVYNQIRYTLSCLVSLLSNPAKYTMELLIGDDCSTDGTGKLGSLSIPGLRYIRHPNNLGFLKNCNEVAESARGRYIVMLNNDTVTLPEWLDSLIDPLDGESDVGLVGSKLVYPDGRLQEAGGVMWEDASGLNWGNLKDPLDPEFNYMREVDYCSGASIALSTELWRKLEGFDGSRYQNAYYEDTDLAFRVREDMKLRVIYQPLSHLLHFEGVSSGRSLDAGIKKFQKTNQPIFVERWREVLANHGTELQHPENFLCRGRTKNLLLIDWITPMPDQDSGSADTFNYLKIFGAMGFNVTLLPEKNGTTDRYVRDVQQMGVRVLHEPYVTDFESALKVEVPKADVIFVYRGSAHRHTPLIRQLAPDTPIVFDTVDLHFLREEREAEVIGTSEAREIAAQTKEQELQAMKLSDVTIVLSEYEEQLLDELVPDVNVARIPIVREVPGRSSESFEQRRDVIFIGGFLHKPNVNAVQYFVKNVWPLVRLQSFDRPCRFVIAGSNIPPEISELADTDIVIKGFVEDLNDLFDSALISVSPLQYGAGLKGKVVSSLSYGVPVVCTAISAEGSGLEHGNNVMIADAPEDMCQYISELHRDAALWQQLSDNGLEFCTQNFSLQSVGVKLEALLDQLKIS